MSEPLEEVQAWLNAELKREVGVTRVTYMGQQKFLAEYINYSAPASRLLGDTEEEALRLLFDYLRNRISIGEPVS